MATQWLWELVALLLPWSRLRTLSSWPSQAAPWRRNITTHCNTSSHTHRELWPTSSASSPTINRRWVWRTTLCPRPLWIRYDPKNVISARTFPLLLTTLSRILLKVIYVWFHFSNVTGTMSRMYFFYSPLIYVRKLQNQNLLWLVGLLTPRKANIRQYSWPQKPL